MGPSGSGKTTLLDVLAGRKTVGEAQGTILFGGTKPSRAFLRRFTGYVEQFDTLLPILTVQVCARAVHVARMSPHVEKRACISP